jgi:hypothetical protein
MKKTRRENMKNANDQPRRLIRYWIKGTKRSGPNPIPTLARPLAIPLFFSNQCERMAVKGEMLRKVTPVPATRPK